VNLARAKSIALIGMEATIVEIEAWIGPGLPRTVIVGLPDTALYESRDRCKAAVASTGLAWPGQVVTINLTPATLPKAGSHYDLGIAAAVLAAHRIVSPVLLEDLVILGELGLDGRVHAVRGVLPALICAYRRGITRAVVPASQMREAGLVEGMTVSPVASLADLIALLNGDPTPPVSAAPPEAPEPSAIGDDLSDVIGLRTEKWALEVAAAGRHHLYFHGPPGVGKTLLASRLPTILPDLTVSEALEVASIHSLLEPAAITGLPVRPPYSDPHHTISLAALVGGGARIARPGAVSRAHRGVLFLDEAPEFPAKSLDCLRTPLESGEILLGRSETQVVYPARFQLVLAANPCPCGFAATPGASCGCTPMAIRRYAARISGPILDRIDIHQHITPSRLSLTALYHGGEESSSVVAARVAEARDRQSRRYRGLPWQVNAEVPGGHLHNAMPSPQGIDLLEAAVSRGHLTPRGADKVIRVAWSIADLDANDRPEADHLKAALALRSGEPLPRRHHDQRR
jgi:magnesium chelatase family protein